MIKQQNAVTFYDRNHPQATFTQVKLGTEQYTDRTTTGLYKKK